MISGEEAAAIIVDRDAPVVYIDTCSLLDLVRGTRDNFTSDCANAAVHILKLAEDKKITIVIPEQVITEFNSNIGETRLSGARSIGFLNDRLNQMRGTLQAYGIQIPFIEEFSQEAYIAAADNVIERFIATSITNTSTVEAQSKAAQRVLIGKAPAASAKQSFKDCLVLESCYETLEVARRNNFGKTAHFLSANTQEYANEAKRRLHPGLVDEFNALNMEYSINFLELRYSNSIKDI